MTREAKPPPRYDEVCTCGHIRFDHRFGGGWCYECDCMDFELTDEEMFKREEKMS